MTETTFVLCCVGVCISFPPVCVPSHSVSWFEDLLILGAKPVEEGVRQLHTAAPQLPCQTEGGQGG